MLGTQDAGYRRPTLQHRHIRRSRLLIAGSATASSSKGLSQCNSRATIYGQIAVVLVLVLLAYFMAAMMYRAVKEYGALPESDIIFIMVIMLSIAATAFFLQFAVPGFFVIRYLGRLRHTAPDRSPGPYLSSALEISRAPTKHDLSDSYWHAPLSIGIPGTCAVYLAGIVLVVVFLHSLAGEGSFGPFLVLLAGVFGPALYNRKTTRFERNRTPIQSSTGGEQFRSFTAPGVFSTVAV